MHQRYSSTWSKPWSSTLDGGTQSVSCPSCLTPERPHPQCTLNKAGWTPETVLFWTRESSLVPARGQTLDGPDCSLVTVLTILSRLLISSRRNRNWVSKFSLSPTFKLRSFHLISAVPTSKYHYHNEKRNWPFNCFSDLPTTTGTDFYVVSTNEQILSPASKFCHQSANNTPLSQITYRCSQSPAQNICTPGIT